MEVTKVFDKTAQALAENRIVVSYGGSSSSKTVSALQLYSIIAQKVPRLVFTIIGESVPVLKRSIIRDFQDIVMGERFDSKRYNKVEMTYRFESDSIFQFVPADDEGRFRGPRQDYSLLDEASNIKKSIFDQVEIRTRKKMIITFNPSHTFWAKRVMDRHDCAVIHSTYKDNQHLEESIIASLENKEKTDPNFYRVYALGEWGTLEGLIFKEGNDPDCHWSVCNSMPEEFEWIGYGLDFGYSDHASALVEVRFTGDAIYCKEVFWRSGMKTQEIYDECTELTNNEQIAADSAEDRLCDELIDMGLNLAKAKKGPGSVKYGINLLKQYKIHIHESSLNLIKDFRNYKRKQNRQGEYLDEPVKLWDEGPDAIRYIFDYMESEAPTGEYFVN